MNVYLLEENVFQLLELDYDSYQGEDMMGGEKATRFKDTMRKNGWDYELSIEGEPGHEDHEINWAFPHPEFNDRITPLRSLEKVSVDLRTSGWLSL